MNKRKIFVFGSNETGIHNGGAARVALNVHGAVMGIGHGRVGNSYAIPTMTAYADPIKFDELAAYVKSFVEYANARQEYDFEITRIGCGIAGFKDEDVAKLFEAADVNCLFDTSWEQYFTQPKNYWGTYEQ